MSTAKQRCPWPGDNPKMMEYHDKEWGVPVNDDTVQFEFLVLETFQSGLSWAIIMNKRENFRMAFDQFDYKKVAAYNEVKYEELMQDAGIIRNKLKIRAAISNANAFLKVQEEFGSFCKYLWGFVDGKQVHNKCKELSDIPAKTDLSDMISNDLKKRGFKFVGSTVIYAHLQATGIVNDHLIDCFRFHELKRST